MLEEMETNWEHSEKDEKADDDDDEGWEEPHQVMRKIPSIPKVAF